MGIRQQAANHLGISIFAPPNLAPTNEKALWACPVIDDRGFLPGQRQHVSLVGDGHAGKIGDVFTQSQLSVLGSFRVEENRLRTDRSVSLSAFEMTLDRRPSTSYLGSHFRRICCLDRRKRG